MKNSVQRLGNITIVGLKAIARNKLRSFLTALGIIIGVGCVIAVVAIGNGASKSVENMINALGTNYIMVFPGAATSGGARMFTGNSTLTPEDAEGIKQDCPAVAYVSPTVRTAAQVVAGELNWGTSIQGVSTDYPFIRSWNVAQGDFFTDADVKSSAKVCVGMQPSAPGSRTQLSDDVRCACAGPISDTPMATVARVLSVMPHWMGQRLTWLAPRS